MLSRLGRDVVVRVLGEELSERRQPDNDRKRRVADQAKRGHRACGFVPPRGAREVQCDKAEKRRLPRARVAHQHQGRVLGEQVA